MDVPLKAPLSCASKDAMSTALLAYDGRQLGPARLPFVFACFVDASPSWPAHRGASLRGAYLGPARRYSQPGDGDRSPPLPKCRSRPEPGMANRGRGSHGDFRWRSLALKKPLGRFRRPRSSQARPEPRSAGHSAGRWASGAVSYSSLVSLVIPSPLPHHG